MTTQLQREIADSCAAAAQSARERAKRNRRELGRLLLWTCVLLGTLLLILWRAGLL